MGDDEMSSEPNGIETAEGLAVAVDAQGIVDRVFPGCFSLRTWRTYDAGGRCPRGFRVGGRKVWRIDDLRAWAEMGFPGRQDFEAHRRAGQAK